jgi:hypothetical protein
MRFKVIERRCYDATYLVDADSAEAASKLQGEVVAEDDATHNSWADELLSVEQVADDEEL